MCNVLCWEGAEEATTGAQLSNYSSLHALQIARDAFLMSFFRVLHEESFPGSQGALRQISTSAGLEELRLKIVSTSFEDEAQIDEEVFQRDAQMHGTCLQCAFDHDGRLTLRVEA